MLNVFFIIVILIISLIVIIICLSCTIILMIHILCPQYFLNDYIMFSLCIDRFDTFSDHTTLSTPFIRFVSVIKSTKSSLFLYTNSEDISKSPTCMVVDKISFISDIFFAVRCS